MTGKPTCRHIGGRKGVAAAPGGMDADHVCMSILAGRPLIGRGSFELVKTITPLSDDCPNGGMLPLHRRELCRNLGDAVIRRRPALAC